MRLINTDTLRVEQFEHSKAPSYAILSHTWGDDEVSFEDILRADAGQAGVTTKRGYRKIASFCKEASSRGFTYGWVDTCCIDKRNSAELSEAINSMYQYYQDSTVCLIHLDDVFKHLAGADKSQMLSSVSKSRWLSRGWTLQELLAPTERQFFDADWNLITDDNTELLGALSTAAGIPTRVLDKTERVEEHCVAERMSWASNRKTTRVEDIAYCLMGIFDVNMPIIYGEGETKAFKRLQAEIMKSSFDQTLFAWRGPYPSSGLLAERPSDFINTPKLSIWTPRYLAPYQMTNVGLSIQVVDVTKGADVERLKVLHHLDLMPPVNDYSVLLGVIQCELVENGLCVGICLKAVDASFRTNGLQVRGYRRTNCEKLSFIPMHLMSEAPFKDVLVLEDSHAELLNLAGRRTWDSYIREVERKKPKLPGVIS